MIPDQRGECFHRGVWNLPGRGARLIVDLDAIEGNVRSIAQNVTPGTAIMAVVKAGGYGTGGRNSALAAQSGGATWLGVATVGEGAQLRASGIGGPIVVLGPTMAAEADSAIRHDLDLTVGSLHHLAQLRETIEAGPADPLRVHLKVDTGMHRFGVAPSEALWAATQIRQSPGLELAGFCTHFARSDEADASPTRDQEDVFRAVLCEIERAGLRPAVVHAANSGAMLRFRSVDFDLVRPGISVYGVSPSESVALFPGMRSAIRVEAALQRIEGLDAGDAVGYGGTYVASKPTRIGLLSLGYADGYRRMFSNRAWVGFRGHRLPIAGRVSMDQTIVEIPPGVVAEFGDIVTVLGAGPCGEPTAEVLATLAETIPYEILTSIGQRLPAYCVRGDEVVAGNDPVALTSEG